ncbi:MAG: AlpA family transcriptional regulator [Deltaproteobacteria bacterium]
MEVSNRLLRLKQVVLKVGLSRSQIYKLIAKGLFPEQTKIGPKISVWPEHAIDQWISRQIEGGVQ